VIAENLARVRERIARAAERAGRKPADVTLVAVAKTKPAELVREAIAAGAADIGENYVQELRAKQEELAALPVRWHFIGRLQKNKAKDLVGRVVLVHSVDGDDLAATLGRRAAMAGVVQEVLVEANLGGEASKGGVAAGAVARLVDRVRAEPALRCVGLMTMPPPGEDPRPIFRALAAEARRLDLPQLSMGMTDDLEIAIEEGATIVRVGTAIFGART
jgi:pyridoxal phosphate enzyme (YggS family)